MTIVTFFHQVRGILNVGGFNCNLQESERNYVRSCHLAGEGAQEVADEIAARRVDD